MAVASELLTARLFLRRPRDNDVESIFGRYASDPEVGRYLGWKCHRHIDETKAFIAFSDAAWQKWGAGPQLIFSRENGQLCGGTGLSFETPYRASTGFVLSKDCWGQGLAAEALRAVLDDAKAQSALYRIYAYCHVDHRASARALEKAGLTLEGVLRRYLVFPNLGLPEPSDVACYAWTR